MRKPHPWYAHLFFRQLLYLGIAVMLMGQDSCENPTPPANEYCSGTYVRQVGAFEAAYEYVANLVPGRSENALLNAPPAEDRNADVQVFFGSAFCSGTVIGPYTVLTAAHCGYGADTTHTIRVDGMGKVPDVNYDSTEKIYHPDYQGWIDRNHAAGESEYFEAGGQWFDTETGDPRPATWHPGHDVALTPEQIRAREADVMLLYTTARLPEPYFDKIYHSGNMSKVCSRVFASGYGKTEANPAPCPDGRPRCLREADYVITQENERTLVSLGADPVKICFGDSGGSLKTIVGENTYIAGVASTTMSYDCTKGSTHSKLYAFRGFVYGNRR